MLCCVLGDALTMIIVVATSPIWAPFGFVYLYHKRNRCQCQKYKNDKNEDRGVEKFTQTCISDGRKPVVNSDGSETFEILYTDEKAALMKKTV
jgi:hypothetical protein